MKRKPRYGKLNIIMSEIKQVTTKRTVNTDQNRIIVIFLFDIIFTQFCERNDVVDAIFRKYRPYDIIIYWMEKSMPNGIIR